MEFYYVVLLFSIGLIGSFISGMLGIGGAIVKFPMILMIPPLFGFQAFTSHQVSGISALDVLFVSIAGVLGYRKAGYINKSLILVMGSSVLIGSLIGSFESDMLTEIQVNIVYGILALIAAIMMFVPKKQIDESHIKQVTFNKPLAAILAFIVGGGSGIVGAGGGFLLIPIMLVVLHIPTRMAIASSLAITFISAIAGSIGKIATGQVEYLPAIIIILAGIIAAPIGAKVSTKLNTKVLENILAFLLLGTAMKVWMDII
ncbi:MAG TPA: sulfite exporter TauE/SafE family protein [Ureibacillus sp.]|nr:sulfite exporter TauE/SafE family protein [Ureibacillus sp.]